MDDVGRKEILQYFTNVVSDSPDMSVAVAAIKTLLHFIENNKFETLAEMIAKMKDAIHCLTKTDSSVTSVSSGCELFLRFITLTNPEESDFEVCQKVFVHRGNLFLQRVASSRQKVAKQADQFVRDGSKILVHSHSRVVQSVLLEASKSKKRFEIYVTESRPNESGYNTCKELSKYGIPCTVILDSAVGYIMEKIDMVLCGAEGVVENGGIINKIGTYSIAIAAKAMNKPFYVVAESFKFVRIFPLNQQDVPNEFKYKASTLRSDRDLCKEHPLVDFTPPNYITLLFTDLGVLTPSAISDELIKLYC